MLSEVLNQAKLNGEIVALYGDRDETTKFEVGYIVEFDKDYFILERVTPAGKSDGYLLDRMQSIYHVELGTLYLKKMLRLINYNGIKRQKNLFDKNDLLLSFIKFAFQDKKIMSIELCDSSNRDIIGRVKKFDSDSCTVTQITDFGEQNGYSTCNLADISSIVYNSEDEKVLEILINCNKTIHI